MAASLEAYADDNTTRQVRHLKEQADRVNLTATRYRSRRINAFSRRKATYSCDVDPDSLSSRYLLRRYASLRRRLRSCSPRYLFRRYPSLIVRGATRSRDSTHLPQHAQLVEVVPAFHYLAIIREAEDAYPAHSNRFAGGSDAPELTLMGAASPPAGHHHVSFGYLILDGGTKVREGQAKLPDKPLDVLGPTLLGTTV